MPAAYNLVDGPSDESVQLQNGIASKMPHQSDQSNVVSQANGSPLATIDPPSRPVERSATESYRDKSSIAYELSKVPLKTSRPIRVVIIGAGISGLSLAHAVSTGRLANVELHILEKNAGLGGTWLENRYPGCACDVPSHNYQFSWNPNPDWSSFYVTAPEILAYLEETAAKFDLRKYMSFCRKVVGATWRPDVQKWEVRSRQTDGREIALAAYGVTEGEVGEDIVEECDILINASGFFNSWRWPSIPGREDYAGTMVHTAHYDPHVDLSGKRVAVIGNGSSGIQVTTAAQKVASHVSVFIRNPTYVTPGFATKFAPPSPTLTFSEEQKNEWKKDPAEYLRFRKAVEKELNLRTGIYLRSTPQQAAARQNIVAEMRRRLAAKPELADAFVPKFSYGCRRATPGLGYLEALCAPNCDVVWGELDKFTARGIKSADGKERDFDVIICATGFDISFVPRWSIVGANGIDLRSAWKQDPAGYMSCVAADMPNYFVYLGPGSPVGAGSLITAVERVTLYVCDMIQKLQTENYSSFQLKAGKAKAYQMQQFAWLDKTVWGDNCSSALKNGTTSGPLYALHPGSTKHYFELLRTRRYEDFDWTSLCPEPELQFAWFNNGFMEHEMTYNDFDAGWYLDPANPYDAV